MTRERAIVRERVIARERSMLQVSNGMGLGEDVVANNAEKMAQDGAMEQERIMI